MLPEDIKNCPVRRSIVIFEGKWNMRVLYELISKSPLRFGELRRAIPDVSATMLASTLKYLEGLGLITRQQFNEIPPHVEYSLSQGGKELIPIFDAIGAWGKKNLKPSSVL